MSKWFKTIVLLLIENKHQLILYSKQFVYCLGLWSQYFQNTFDFLVLNCFDVLINLIYFVVASYELINLVRNFCRQSQYF